MFFFTLCESLNCPHTMTITAELNNMTYILVKWTCLRLKCSNLFKIKAVQVGPKDSYVKSNGFKTGKMTKSVIKALI